MVKTFKFECKAQGDFYTNIRVLVTIPLAIMAVIASILMTVCVQFGLNISKIAKKLGFLVSAVCHCTYIFTSLSTSTTGILCTFHRWFEKFDSLFFLLTSLMDCSNRDLKPIIPKNIHIRDIDDVHGSKSISFDDNMNIWVTDPPFAAANYTLDGKYIRRVENRNSMGIMTVYAYDGHLWTGHYGGGLNIWCIETGKHVGRRDPVRGSNMYKGAIHEFYADPPYMWVCGARVQKWDLKTKTLICELAGNSSPLYSITITNNFVYAGGTIHQIFKWNKKTGEFLGNVITDNCTTDYPPQNKHWGLVSHGETVYVDSLWHYECEDIVELRENATMMKKYNNLINVLNDGGLSQYNLDGKLVNQISAKTVRSFDIRGNYVVFGHYDRKVSLYIKAEDPAEYYIYLSKAQKKYIAEVFWLLQKASCADVAGTIIKYLPS